MSDLGNKRIMANNIQYYMDMLGKSRSDVCEAIGVKYTTFTDWVKGNTYPRIDKIELMANYFGISKSDLVESQEKTYYQDESTVTIAQKLFDSKEMRLLFDAAKGSKPEDLKMAADLLIRLKGTNPDG